MSKENDLFEIIKKFVKTQCAASFQYCGVAEADNKVIINTGDNITLKITIELIDFET